ncbi:hypothetical protein BCT63_15355 [Vibrio kanaloae]|uniref:hypothetical protein n=1 Tax=Vibrio kanaloae TaxID=170673 RepID=UPI000C82B357|nr:hypothetical protein [Vibrio kanaloae]PMM03168.1 hypothetical protein BCT63_15355 [Vibrio kanaloae]
MVQGEDGVKDYPSIFTNSRVINKKSNSIFNNEFSYNKRLVVEHQDSNVISIDATMENYLYSYLFLLSEEHDFERELHDKYYLNMEKWIDKSSFLKNISELYISDSIVDSKVCIDILVSAAIYKDIQRFSLYERFEKYVYQYVKFHSDDYINMTSFAVYKDIDFDSLDFSSFLSVISGSLKTVRDKQYVGIDYQIVDDFEHYIAEIDRLISNTHAGSNDFTISDFTLAKRFNLNNSERLLNIEGLELSYSDVEIVDITKMEIKPLGLATRTKISGADRLYLLATVDGNLVIPVPREFMQMWNIVRNRYNILIEEQGKEIGYEVISNTNKIKSITSFPSACYVVQQHNNITSEKAEDILVKWLIPIAGKNRELLLKLISAHECMTKKDIDDFIFKISKMCDSGVVSVMIKNPEDYNGTQRILYDDLNYQVGRNIKNFSVSKLTDLDGDVNEVTFIMDNIISGSQFISAIKYYAGERDTFSDSENLYLIPEGKLEKLRAFFRNLEKINICTVFYNTKAKLRIEEELKLFMPNLKDVVISHGKNIRGNAFFGTTEKLSNFDRANLEEFLLDDARRKELHESVGIKFNKDVKKFRNNDELQNMNLVSRYRSMPKNCFMFLIAPSIFDKKIRILNRYEELNSKSYIKS